MAIGHIGMLQILSEEFRSTVPDPLHWHDASAVLDDGIVIHCAAAEEGPVMHDSFVQDGQVFDQVSAYSSKWYWLRRQEWYRLNLDVDFSGGELKNSSEPLVFHGTEWGFALKIVWHCQGFIVGPGTHRVGKKSLAGCWCVDSLGEAIRRSNPERYHFRGDFTRMCCPVALEIQAVHLRKIPQTYGTNKYCAPAPIGTVHQGLLIRAVHFNTRFMKNYVRLENPMLRQRLRQDPFHCGRCACGWCGQVCLPEDPLYWDQEVWVSSNASKYYTKRCYKVITAESAAEYL